MLVGGKNYHTIWLDKEVVKIIDQRYLPHKFVIEEISTVQEMITAIRQMHLRGAILIGVAGAYGVYLSALQASRLGDFDQFYRWISQLKEARPTAVNLSWAVERQLEAIEGLSDWGEICAITKQQADSIKQQELLSCKKIGEVGVELIERIYNRKKSVVNILTHCNAGWLACVDYGTATSPIYEAHRRGIPIHIWVDETRPRNQGARLTAWELLQEGISHSVVADNTGGYLMQQGMVDMVIVGADRVSRRGDVANKIGTYLKALAAKDNGVPFYVAVPSSTFDFDIYDGVREIPIEERSEEEVRFVWGKFEDRVIKVLITPEGSRCCNYAFDVTPFNLVTALITEKGIIPAQEDVIVNMLGDEN